MRDMSEGVMIIGLNGTIQYMNPAAADILNKKHHAKPRKLSQLINDERNNALSEAILDAMADKNAAHYKLINYYTDRDVKTIYVMSSFLTARNKKLALIVILNDMTNLVSMRKRYSDQLLILMDSLVRALSVAIEERSQYNANHTANMVKMAEAFINWMDRTANPRRFDTVKKHAFLMSVWLHDVGKLSVPLAVMNKASRLSERIHTIEDRFGRIHLLDRLALSEGRLSQQTFEANEEARREWLDFIKKINTAALLSDEELQKVQALGSLRYTEEDGSTASYLTPDELHCLSVRKGTLTDEERAVMQNHVVVTKKILDTVTFPDEYAMVPQWAGSHHELKNGKGYPKHLRGEEIPSEVCLLTILDVFEALTATDRPYKTPLPAARVWSILHSMADEGSLDKDMLSLFEQSGAWKTIL